MALLVARRTILVVEDNAADAGLVVEALDECESAPLLQIVTGGREALACLRSDHTDSATRRPSLVLLDLNLPGFSGLDTLIAIKADPDLRAIPVIVLTTSKSQTEINRCYSLGAAAVLNKPLRLREYREMLNVFERFWLGCARLPEVT